MNSELSNLSAVIPMGGKGTRLKEISGDTPKALFPINGKSTIERCCEQLIKNGIRKIFITLAYNNKICSEIIKKLEEKYSISIKQYIENEPMGECGALWEIKNELTEKIFFINGDLIFSISFKKLISFHNRVNSQLTLVTHITDHPEDSDLIGAPNGTQIEKISFKNEPINLSDNLYLGNAAIAVINKELLNKVNRPTNFSSASLFNHLVKNSFYSGIRVYSYNTTEYIKDMGTKARFLKVEKDLENNLVYKNNYDFKQKALFVDRDNTLIYCDKEEYILNSLHLKFIDKNIKIISDISKEFNFVCLITNQPQISMGLISYEVLDEIHSKLLKYCLKLDLRIDLITFCPHHPHGGFLNEMKYLKKDCFCRKPQPGMILEQEFLRNIDLKNSLFIGDSIIDQKAAENAGVPFKNIKDILK